MPKINWDQIENILFAVTSIYIASLFAIAIEYFVTKWVFSL